MHPDCMRYLSVLNLPLNNRIGKFCKPRRADSSEACPPREELPWARSPEGCNLGLVVHEREALLIHGIGVKVQGVHAASGDITDALQAGKGFTVTVMRDLLWN